MRTGLTALTFLALLLGVHLAINLITFPEFHNCDSGTLQEHAEEISRLDEKTRQDLLRDLNWGQMNGKRGSSLALTNLAVDGMALLIVTCLLVTTYRRASKEYRLNKRS